MPRQGRCPGSAKAAMDATNSSRARPAAMSSPSLKSVNFQWFGKAKVKRRGGHRLRQGRAREVAQSSLMDRAAGGAGRAVYERGVFGEPLAR